MSHEEGLHYSSPYQLIPSNGEIADRNRAANFESSIRRGGAAIGRAVGNFMGLTNESQHGTTEAPGWEDVIMQRRTEEGSLLRSLTVRGHGSNKPPPSYGLVTEGHSFDRAQLEEDEEEEPNGFITRSPPDYNAVVQRDIEPQHYPEPTHPAQGDFISDKDEGYAYYKRFITAENRLRGRRQHYDALEFFGGGAGAMTQSGDLTRSSTRRARLDQPGVRPKKAKVTKLQRQSTLVRREVASLPTFWPICIVLISLAQIGGLITIMVITRPIAPINIMPEGNVGVFPTLKYPYVQSPNTTTNSSNTTASNITSISPTPKTSVAYYLASNLWIGPRPVDLIRLGAKFSPCMRVDTFGIVARNFKIFADDSLVCCLNGNNIGATLSKQCGGINAGLASTNSSCANNTVVQNYTSVVLPNYFRPCCLSIVGDCNVTSKEECTARKGYFHETADNCKQVNCLKDICGFNGAYIGSQTGLPYQPTANQFWRWVMALFVHLGVIHLVLVLPIQLYIGIKIERTIGWLRVGLIYIISGVGGNIVSGVFAPYEVNGGSTPAIFGMLGVLYVELFQFWQIVDRAWLELIKLTSFVIILLFLGTFPFIDNWAHLGGLLFGVVSAVIFVPYITFGKLDACRKRVVLLICLPLLFLLFIAGFVTFYLLGGDYCPNCRYINCIPYTSGLCTTDYADIYTYIPAL